MSSRNTISISNSVSAATLVADLYYNILDGAAGQQGLAAAGCAPPLNGADSASAQAVGVTVTQSPPSMLHNNHAAWADFGSQPLFLPGHGDLQYATVDGEFVKQCRAADAYPPEGGGGASQCKPGSDLVPQQQEEGATARSLIPVFLEPKCAAGDFMPEPAMMAPVMDFMEAILGSSSTSAASASSLDSFSANAGMHQSHCWIP